MKSEMEYSLLIVGIILIAFGLYFVIKRYRTSAYVLVLFLGTALAVLGVLRVSNAKLKFFGFEADFTLSLAQAVEDIKIDDITRLNLETQKANDALAKQEKFNQELTEIVNRLQQASVVQDPDINDQGALFKRNNQYSVLVFYRASRRADAFDLQKALTAAGYAATTLATDLSEVKIEIPPPMSTVIIPTARGAAVGADVLALAKIVLPEAEKKLATLGDPYPLQRGDLQMLLF